MRRICLGGFAAVLVLGIVAEPTRAQFPVAFVGGTYISKVSLSGDDAPTDVEFDYKTRFFGAVGTSIALSPTVSISPYVGYVGKGWKQVEDGVQAGEASLDYIEIPVFLGVNVPITRTVALNLSAGPQVSFELSCDLEFDGETVACDDQEEFLERKSATFGALGGAGLNIQASPSVGIFFGGGYDLGLSNIVDEPSADISAKHRSIFLYAGFGIVLGGGGM